MAKIYFIVNQVRFYLTFISNNLRKKIEQEKSFNLWNIEFLMCDVMYAKDIDFFQSNKKFLVYFQSVFLIDHKCFFIVFGYAWGYQKN